MSKYKICKFVNGNGEEWYQVQKKCLFFWYYLWGYKGGAPEFTPTRIPLVFNSIKDAIHHIDLQESVNRSTTIKKVDCFDYVGE